MKIYNQKMIEIDKLKPYDKNARTHSSEQIAQIMQSIKEFGFTNPLLIDSDFNLIAGHGRLEAIKGLNKVDFKDKPILQVPCVICEGLSEVQKKALILADNKIALNAGWDEDILARELKELDECGFDLDLTGFSDGEVDEYLKTSGVGVSADNYDDVFTIPTNERSKFRTYTLVFSAENLQIVENFIKKYEKTLLAEGDNMNAKTNIFFNALQRLGDE